MAGIQQTQMTANGKIGDKLELSNLCAIYAMLNRTFYVENLFRVLLIFRIKTMAKENREAGMRNQLVHVSVASVN